MPGIYIHIPYCKQACHYCDFHFSTSLKTKSSLIESLIKELEIRSDYLPTKIIDTIYFGGGSPSIVSIGDLEKLLTATQETYTLAENGEITLEANPDDIDLSTLENWKSLGVNRLSIGIQSFNDDFLRLFNRAHTAKMATESVENARRAGFDNISVDLIFGTPGQSMEQFRDDLNKTIQLNTEHISIYGLTIEEKTVFGKWMQEGKLKPLDEESAALQFEHLMEKLGITGFSQYEVSNFAKPGYESRHNSNYWNGNPYLGIGPGAHSFDINSRQYNVSNNSKYIKSISNGTVPFEKEYLSESQKINEYILTKIRTANGIDFQHVMTVFGFDFQKTFHSAIRSYESSEHIIVGENLRLTRRGKLLVDSITESFLVD